MNTHRRTTRHTHTHIRTHTAREFTWPRWRGAWARLTRAGIAAIIAAPLAATSAARCEECEDFVVDLGTAPVVREGETTEANNNCELESGPDALYKVYIPGFGKWRFTLCNQAAFDTVLYVGTTCCGDDVGSNDDFQNNRYDCGETSEVTVEIEEGE